MEPEHAITISDPRRRTPPVLIARCTCGWSGSPRTGRNAESLARADGNQHLEQVESRESG